MRSVLPMLLASCVIASSGTAAADDMMTDEQGRTFRVAFDPGSELRLGMVGGAFGLGTSADLEPAVVTGLGYRAQSSGGFKHEQVSWQLDHRTFWGTIRPWGGDVDGIPAMDAMLYSGTYLRHTDEPFLMLPSSPPRRVYFPFDIGVQVEAGRVRLTPAQGQGAERLRVGAARATVLLDPVRSGKPGNSLPIGFGLRYDIDFQGTPELDSRSVVHRVAPFSEVIAGWRYQDEPGLTTFELQGSWFPHWASRGGWQTDAFETSASFHRVLIAVNDTPVSALVDGGYSRYPGVEEWRALAGVRVGWQLK